MRKKNVFTIRLVNDKVSTESGSHFQIPYEPTVRFYTCKKDAYNSKTFPEDVPFKYILEATLFYWRNPEDKFTIKDCSIISVFSDVYRCAVGLLEKILKDQTWSNPTIQTWTEEDYIGAAVIDAHWYERHSIKPEHIKLFIQYMLEFKIVKNVLPGFKTGESSAEKLFNMFAHYYYQQLSQEIEELYLPVKLDNGENIEGKVMMEYHAREHFSPSSGTVDKQEYESKNWWLNLRTGVVHYKL